MGTPRIIILGGGFAGAKCARVLSRQLDRNEADLVLFNRENHLVFSPLLADAVGSSINLLDVVVPLRKLLPRVHCRTEEILRILPDSNEIEYEGHDGQQRRMSFDHLVIACGTVANLNVVPGMADHAFPLKTVGDVAVLRSHILEQLEKAEVCDDPSRRSWYLTFIVVGGGYSGVEVAGEINDLVRSSLRFFKNIRSNEVSVQLIHSGAQLLPEIGDSLREFARRKMEQAGVRVTLNARAHMATPEGVGIQDGPFLRGATVVCTVGTSIARVIDQLAVVKERGRLVTDPDMRLRGVTNVWAIGDCASITNQHDGKPSPPTGQFAERQGRQCADNIVRALHRLPTRAFAFKPLGQLCSIGGHSAVAELFGFRLSGFFAWFAWRGVYLFKLPTWSRRIQVGMDWAWLLFFPRDLSHIKTNTTDRVTHAHYEIGDFIMRAGDASSCFYIVQKGEVEVIRPTNAQPDGEIVAVLGPGSFFGERGLMDNRPRAASIRARTAVEVLIVGKKAFGEISTTLSPLRDALAKRTALRESRPWHEHPGVASFLSETTVHAVMEPPPEPMLSPTGTLDEVNRVFASVGPEFHYVVDNTGRLVGVITMTDLIRAQGIGSADQVQIRDVMVANPVYVLRDDPLTIAANAFREHGIKTLPVVDPSSGSLAGCVTARRLMSLVLEHVHSTHPEVAKVSENETPAGN